MLRSHPAGLFSFSLPPCGGGTGRGVSTTSIVVHHPHPTPALPPSWRSHAPHEQGGGSYVVKQARVVIVSWRTSVQERYEGHRRKASAPSGKFCAGVSSLDTASVVRSVSDRTSPTSRVLSAALSSKWTVVHTTTPPDVGAMPNATSGSQRRDSASFAWRTVRFLKIRRRRSRVSAGFSVWTCKRSAPPPPRPSPVKGEGARLRLSR